MIKQWGHRDRNTNIFVLETMQLNNKSKLFPFKSVCGVRYVSMF